MMHKVLAVLIAMTLPFSLAAAAVDGGDRPLLMEGKRSLYQRVLATPDARLAAEPGGRGNAAVVPFTSFYVYARREHGGTQWIEVGVDRHGTRAGWLPATSTLEWNHGLTAVFRNPTGHDRVLLFKDRDSLRELVRERDLTVYEGLYEEAQQEVLSPNSPVVAIQPPGFIDIQDDFYLVPIRQHEDIYLESEQARLLQVSSVPLVSKPAVTTRTYSAGLAFVIDSTLSMDPYIQRTREAVKKIYDTLGEADLLGDVSFGLVAFRDNLSTAPGLRYLVRTFVDLEQGRDAASFLSRVNSLQASDISSQDFVEDAYAGVKEAIEAVDWSEYEARYIVLITDAGARGADDPLSGTGMSPEGLRKLAQQKGIAIFVLHLLTPATMANHETAAEQYRALADFPGIGSLYYGVPTGDVEKFGVALDTLAGQITEQVRLAATDQRPVAPVPTSTDTQLAELQAKVAKLGYALRMKYLQKSEGGQVPTVFDAWLLDRDFRDPQRAAVDVRVLLTRDQLSDLHDVLSAVLERAEEGMLSPQTFLEELQSLAATMARDPTQLGGTTATTAGEGNSLAQLGFMREYIEDLPYAAEVMGLSLDDWQSWSTKQQVAFVTRLEDKIDYYRALHDHTDLWVSLDDGPVDGDSVFPVPLEVLP
ncbi:MAG: VWA domain-containing protein [Gammaproteobacteria bacterium]|nr:VWA domain-containing protein [Gammaproteobacteria bacterium]